VKLKIRNVWWDDERDHLGRTEVCRNKAVLVEDLRALLEKWIIYDMKECNEVLKMCHCANNDKIISRWCKRFDLNEKQIHEKAFKEVGR